MSDSGLPTPTPAVRPEAKPFWDAAAEGQLMLQRCSACDTVVWYPRGFCPECGGIDLEWFVASGRGTIYTYTVIRRGAVGAYAEASPYVLAYVELEEGPRIMTNIVHCNPDEVAVGDSVSSVFESAGDEVALVRFRPA